MPYRHVEQLNDRANEKLAAFLTASNMAGLVLVAGPLYVLSAPWPLLVRAPTLLLAAALGIWLTLPQQGIPRYSRLVWRVRGIAWQRASRRVIGPDDLRSVVSGGRPVLLLTRAGPARIVTRRPLAIPQVPTSFGSATTTSNSGEAMQTAPLVEESADTRSEEPDGHLAD